VTIDDRLKDIETRLSLVELFLAALAGLLGINILGKLL
jgi:hypothetical protein